MDRILNIRARRAAILTEMDAITQAINVDAGMTDEQSAAFRALGGEDDKLQTELRTLEDVERRRASAAVPVGVIAQPVAPTAPARVAEKGVTFARMTRYMAAAGGSVHVASQIAEANGDSGLFANQNMGSGAAGGFLVPEDVSTEIIELLRPASVVMGMGVRRIPLPNGNLTTNRRASGALFGYIGEQADIPATGMTFGQMKLSLRKLSGLVPISNDLLRSASAAVDILVRDDMVEGAASATDLNFLRSVGTENAPVGLRHQLTGTSFAALNILTMTATPDLQKVTADLGRLELALQNQNIDPTGAHWVTSPRVAMYLRNFRDGNGNLAFPEVQNGQLRGKPLHVTNHIPANLGGGTESEIALIHPSHVIVGEGAVISLAVSTEAAYKDASGTMQAAFSRDETVMRLILQHDIALRHLPAVAWLTGVTWGA
jgi:HK97 family phage major capsid protein